MRAGPSAKGRRRPAISTAGVSRCRVYPIPRRSIAPPAADKWLRETRAGVERILPVLAPFQAALGYPTDIAPTHPDQGRRTLARLPGA